MGGGDIQFLLSHLKPFGPMDLQSLSFSNGHSALLFCFVLFVVTKQ